MPNPQQEMFEAYIAQLEAAETLANGASEL